MNESYAMPRDRSDVCIKALPENMDGSQHWLSELLLRSWPPSPTVSGSLSPGNPLSICALGNRSVFTALCSEKSHSSSEAQNFISKLTC